MNKKIFILFSLLLVFFVSCQSNTEKTLTYNLVSEPTTIDPHNFNELVSVQLMNNIYEGLLRIDEKGNYVPALAKSYTENGTKLTFTLKDNLKWSDGSKLTIDDIIFGFKRALDKNTASHFAEYLFPIKNAKKFNAGLISEKELGIQNVDGKLVITLEKPTPYFKDILTLPISFPVKKGITQDIGDYTKALYNGPYIIQKMDNSSIILKENKYYWNKKETKFKNVKLLFISDFGVLENLIKNSEVDLARVEPYDLNSKRKNNELLSYTNGRIWYLDFNLDNPILKNMKYRIAIRNSIDRQKYVDIIKEDGSKVAKSVISDILGNYRKEFPDNNYFKDNIKSNILAGKKLRLLTGNSSVEVKEANFIQEELRTKLKLDVVVTTVSFKDRLALTRSKDFDMVLNTYSPKFNDPISVLNRWYNKKLNNWSQAKYDALIDEINEEQDTQKRYLLMNKAEKLLIDEAIIAPLYYSTENWYIRKGLSNIVIHPITNTMDLFRIK